MQMEANLDKLRSLECSVISPLKVLYFSTQSVDVRVGSLKILLHVLEVMLLLTGQVLFSFFVSLFLESLSDVLFKKILPEIWRKTSLQLAQYT